MQVHATGYAVSRQDDVPCDDAWLVRERAGTTLAALADGIGSAREGGAAARRAVEMLADYCLSRPRNWTPRRALVEFSAQVNRTLHTESLARHGQPELTCTLSAVLLEASRLYGCNIGDSPVFHWRQGRLTRLSETHSLASPELTHVLTRAIGLESDVAPHFFEMELAPGDLIFLCSDGVSNAVSETRLVELLSRQATARSIVSAARIAGEENPEVRDDASAIVLDLVAGDGSVDPTRHPLEVIPVLRAGDTCNAHTLLRPLAGNDRVWLAEPPVSPSPPLSLSPSSAPSAPSAAARVVLKFPSADAADSEPLREGFLHEMRNAIRLTSPDLVRAWIPPGPTLCCYAMEFVNAPTLRAVLHQGRLTVEDTCELARFLLRVGQFLLRSDLAHGDIKPDNLLVLREPTGITFRLLDLGSAAELFSVTSRAGTPSYLAPERFRGGALSERTEIFAIAVTLYEALTGTYPYGEVERFHTPRFDHVPRRLSRLNPAVPNWLDAVILRALDPDPERRYQNFSELAYDLAHPALVTSHHRKDAPLIERNPLHFYKTLSALFFVVILVLGYLLLRRS